MPELKLPERLREMDMKSMSDMPRSVSDAVSERLAKVDLSKMDVKVPKVDVKVPEVKVPDIKRPSAQDVWDRLPQRGGPSPVPFLLFGLLGGVVLGILAATSSTFGPMIRSALGDAQDRLQGVMPNVGDRAGQLGTTVRSSLSTAGKRAEKDYRDTLSTSAPGSSSYHEGVLAGSGSGASGSGSSYGGSSGTTGDADGGYVTGTATTTTTEDETFGGATSGTATGAFGTDTSGLGSDTTGLDTGDTGTTGVRWPEGGDTSH